MCEKRLRGSMRRRGAEVHRRAEHYGGFFKRGGNVVARVAKVCNTQARYRPESRADREHIRQSLTGVRPGRKAIDHRNTCGLGEALKRLVVVWSNDHGIDVARKPPRGVLGRFARPAHELRAVREERFAAEPCDRDLKRHPGPQARFFEKQRDGAPTQEGTLLQERPALEEARQSHDALQLVGREVSDLEEMPATKPQRLQGGWRNGVHVLYIYTYGA